MTDAVTLPRFDFTRMRWHPSPDNSNLYVREAMGGEEAQDVFNRLNYGDQTVFLGLEISISDSIPPEQFILHARNAWVDLRFEIPTIASQTALDSRGNTLITYQRATACDDVDKWAQRTVRLSEDAHNLEQLRYELGKKTIPEENGDQTFIYVVPRGERAYGLLLHSSHVPFDGGGLNILLNKYLARLAHLITPGAPQLSFEWGKEIGNLLPAACDVVGTNEDRTGGEYNQTLSRILSDTAKSMPRMHGFTKCKIGPGPTHLFRYKFTAADTEQMLGTIRKLGFTAYPSLIAVVAQEVRMVMDGVRSAATPPPPWMGPWCAGDGIGETYLDYLHSGYTGKPMLKVNDFFVSLNKSDPGPYFRATSWKGQLQLSIDGNEYAMPRDVVQGFMDKWVEILLVLIC